MTQPAVELYGVCVPPLGWGRVGRFFYFSPHRGALTAAAIGCNVGAIVKSLLFEADGAPLLVLASGPNRVDTAALGARLGAGIGKADAAAVKQATGYSIGAVPPLGHVTRLRTVFDETLLQLPVVWAAAGSATAVFAIDPAELARLCEAEILPIGG